MSMSVPIRPGIVIRAPDREESKDREFTKFDSNGNGKNEETKESNLPSEIKITIYTNSATCRYSQELLCLTKSKGLTPTVIDISKCVVPKWLPGTPTVVYRGDVYCGDAAFDFVSTIHMEGHQGASVGTNVCVPRKVGDVNVGCGIAEAFQKPKEIEVDESIYNMSTEETMQKLLAGRRN